MLTHTRDLILDPHAPAQSYDWASAQTLEATVTAPDPSQHPDGAPVPLGPASLRATSGYRPASGPTRAAAGDPPRHAPQHTTQRRRRGPHQPMVDTKRPAQYLVEEGRLKPLPHGDQWVFIREAAEAAHIHPNTLRTAVKVGALHAERLTKNTLVLRLSEVLAYKHDDTMHRSKAQLKRHERERVEASLRDDRYDLLMGEVRTLSKQVSEVVRHLKKDDQP